MATAHDVFNDYVTPDVPSSGLREPVLSEIRALLAGYEGKLDILKNFFTGTGPMVGGILVSQSNGYSNDLSYGGGDTATNAACFAWANSSSVWSVAALGADPFRPAGVNPAPNNLGFHFIKKLNELTGREQRFFMHAIPDTSIDVWLTVANGGPNTSANRYDGSTSTAGGTVLKTQTLATAMFASSALTSAGKSRFDYIIIVKGENEEGIGVDVAHAKYLTVIDQLRAETWADDDTVIFVVEMIRERNKYPGAIEAWSRIARHSLRPNVLMVTSAGLASVGDGTHFSGAAHVTLGRERLLDAVYGSVAPRRYPASFDGRSTVHEVNVATTAAAPAAITPQTPNEVINVLYSVADSHVKVTPTNVGTGGMFWVCNWDNIYTTYVYPDTGSIEDPNIWDIQKTVLALGPLEYALIAKLGQSETGQYRVLCHKKRNYFDMDRENGVGNGSLEMLEAGFDLMTWDIQRDNTTAYNGNGVAKNSDTSGNAQDMTSLAYQACEPGDIVHAEARSKTDVTMTISSFRLQIVWYDRQRVELSNTQSVNYSSASTSYQKMSCMGAAPATAVFWRLRVRVNKTVGAVYVDQLFAKRFRKDGAGISHMLRQSSDRTLTSNTSQQKIFDTATAGAFTAEIGLYKFYAKVRLTGLSASSGTISFGFLGTATSTIDLAAIAKKAGGLSNAEMVDITSAGGTVLVTASTATQGHMLVEGTVNVTAAGTLIPAITMSVAAAATVKADSFAEFTRIGQAANGDVAMANWS